MAKKETTLFIEREYWFIIFAAVLYGTITVGAQFFTNLGLSLFEITLYRVVFASLILLPIVLIKRRYLIKKRMIIFFTIYGLVGAMLGLAEFGGIVLGVPVAVVVFLLYTQPIWTIIFGKLMLNEKITPRKVMAVFVALIGVVVLLKSWATESVGSLAGIISALIAGVLLSLWIILGRKSGVYKQHPITTITGWVWSSSIWLLLLWPIFALLVHEPNISRFSISFPVQYWPYFIIFASIACVIPGSLFYRGVQKIHASVAGIILLLEPVSATILASLLFAQPVGLNIFLGGALILFSNYLVIRKQG